MTIRSRLFVRPKVPPHGGPPRRRYRRRYPSWWRLTSVTAFGLCHAPDRATHKPISLAPKGRRRTMFGSRSAPTAHVAEYRAPACVARPSDCRISSIESRGTAQLMARAKPTGPGNHDRAPRSPLSNRGHGVAVALSPATMPCDRSSGRVGRTCETGPRTCGR